MQRAFVTGITGQTGSYLAEQLVADGWEVHGLVRSADARRDAFRLLVPDAVLHTGDLADLDGVAGLIGRLEPTAIFNLGGISSVAQSWSQPVETAKVSGVAVAAILEAALRLQERSGTRVTVVQASSAEIFGQAERAPQTEDTPIRPSNPYGAAKAYGHQLVRVYRERGLAAGSCILFNHESPRRPPTFVTRKITRAAARIRLGLQDRLSLGNLEARRDWGWAPDYAHAIRLTAQTPDDYVIATGTAHTVSDFVIAAFDAAGVDDWQDRVDVDTALLRQGDAADQVGDAAKARRTLGWAPSVTFDEIVQAMVDADLAEASAAQ
jgi:GDPmannose 4,6-dehydratase